MLGGYGGEAAGDRAFAEREELSTAHLEPGQVLVAVCSHGHPATVEAVMERHGGQLLLRPSRLNSLSPPRRPRRSASESVRPGWGLIGRVWVRSRWRSPRRSSGAGPRMASPSRTNAATRLSSVHTHQLSVRPRQPGPRRGVAGTANSPGRAHPCCDHRNIAAQTSAVFGTSDLTASVIAASSTHSRNDTPSSSMDSTTAT